MTSESSASSSDPLKAVADALDAAVKVAREGAEGARLSAAEALPEAERQLSRMIYNACYYLSYGVVFPTVFVARTIPQNNPVVHGLIDGAHAAMDMVQDLKTSQPTIHESSAGAPGPFGEHPSGG